MSGLGLLFWMDLHESSGDSAAYQKNTEYEIAGFKLLLFYKNAL